MNRICFILALVLYTIGSLNAQLTNHLIICLPFDGTFADTSGQINYIHYSGGDTVFAPDRFGVADKALYFDGIDDVVVADTSDVLRTAAVSNVTISFWFKFITKEDTSWVFQMVDDGYQGATNGYYAVRPIQDTIAFIGNPAPNGAYEFKDNNAIDTSLWYFICASVNMNNGYALLYINGAFVDSNIIAGCQPIPHTRIYLGQSFPLWSPQHTRGYIDQLAIYDYIMTPAEIDSLYNSSTT
jgi:hypothetical protein